MPGPAPTPRKILELRGSTRATRKPEAGGVSVPAETPVRPAWLSTEAAAVWDQVVPLLAGAQVLGRVDTVVLSTFCTTWAHWRMATKEVDEHGVTYEVESKNGTRRYTNPAVAVASSLAAELRALGDRLGLSPAARARIRGTEAPLPAGDAGGPDYFRDAARSTG